MRCLFIFYTSIRSCGCIAATERVTPLVILVWMAVGCEEHANTDVCVGFISYGLCIFCVYGCVGGGRTSRACCSTGRAVAATGA